MKTILFLGDSITDSHRNFINPPLGCGYVSLISGLLHKEGFETNLFNLGVDGFTIQRLLENFHSQYQNIPADIVTILIGINDIGLMMNTCRTKDQQEQMLQTFFLRYEELLKNFSSCQIILLEPFLFPYPVQFQNWIPWVRQMSEGIRSLADTYSIPFISLQDSLNDEAKRYGMNFITTDGIHLTSQGHEIIAEKLLHTLKTYV